jgi:curved DNA-binding protein CbpA
LSNYYEVLGVSKESNQVEIKKAYKSLALKLHPDRNNAPDAQSQFVRIQQAYEVLGDTEKRAIYDVELSETPSNHSYSEDSSAQQAEHGPIKCSCCNQITAQPRYVIYYTAISAIFFSTRQAKQGIFCHKCLNGKLIKSTVISMLFGWWSFPWGPIYTLQALFNNLKKGYKPAIPNAYLLASQSQYFLTQKKYKVSYALYLQSKSFYDASFNTKVSENEYSEQVSLLHKTNRILTKLKRDLHAHKHESVLKNQWQNVSLPVIYSLCTISVIAASLIYALNQDALKEPDKSQTTPIDYATLKRGSESPTQTKNTPDIVRAAKQIRPPYGNDWPSKASYIPGTLIENLGGDSSVKIDNSKNNYAVHIKLVDLKSNRRIREVYLPAFESFVIDALEQGTYDIRLKYLHSGEVQKTPRIELSESSESATIYELTLSKVINGNLKLQTISEAEF